MDIAKYIGLFLHKNRYCSIPNLGEFTVVKKSAEHADDQIKSPQYEVSFAFSGGLIDDAFANFVANNERTSIASAANAIKDFSLATRKTLSEGGTVIIPGYGKFVRINGVNEFHAEPGIQVEEQGIPIFKINTQATKSTLGKEKISDLHERMQIKEPTSADEIVIKPPKVNWPKVIGLIAVVLLVIGGIAAAIWYMNSNKPQETVVSGEPTQSEMQQSAAAIPDSTTNDTANTAQLAATNTSNTATVAGGKMTFGILKYSTAAAAERKAKQLKSYGHDADIKTKSETEHTVIIRIPEVADVEKAKDSLRRFFNPRGTVTVE